MGKGQFWEREVQLGEAGTVRGSLRQPSWVKLMSCFVLYQVMQISWVLVASPLPHRVESLSIMQDN